MKGLLKNTVFILSTIFILPLILIYKLYILIDNSDSTFASFSQLLSLIPGKIGVYLRSSFYYFCTATINKSSTISFLSLFSQKNTGLEKNVYIGPQCNIGLCHIKTNTLIGSGVHIMSGKNQHNINDLETPIKDQGGVFKKIEIGEDCWIGNGCMIMANIGNKCIIGAGSVVINDIPDYSIAAGNPAKVIKSRINN